MLFGSHEFILFFLPIVLIGYYFFNSISKFNFAKVWLLVSSLIFYGYFNWNYLIIIISSIIFNYIIYFNFKKNIFRKLSLFIGMFFNIGLLFYFKYFNFFIENINIAFSTNYIFNDLILPLGISFFTFQQISFIIDNFKSDKYKYSMLDYSLYVTFFPQLIAGPIVLHSELINQFEDENKKKFNYQNFWKGIFAFTRGIAKKVLIADLLAKAVNLGFGDVSTLNSASAFFVMICYTLQIYFDFSGYSDMAIGLGHMFNIELPINFNSPYKAKNILEFWKRWHITLTRFFTQYVYIPLGGNRRRVYLNVFIVFLVSGLWHGANYTFIVWGVLHGVASIITRIFIKKINKLPNIINYMFTFSFINLTWIIFRSNSLSEAFMFFEALFSFNGLIIDPNLLNPTVITEIDALFILLGMNDLTNILAIVLVIIYTYSCFNTKNTTDKLITNIYTNRAMLISVFLFVLSVLSMSGVSDFLYWNF